MVNIFDQIVLLTISLIANTLSALAGGGAGLLQFPALLFLGLPFTTALATHKIATVALGAGATLKHWRQGNTQWFFAILILISGLPGVILGARVIIEIPESIAKFSLGVLTIGLSVYSLCKPQLGQDHTPINRNARGYFIGAAMLFTLGVLNGSLTSGTGLFVTLWLILWFGFDYQRAVAYTMILVGLFWNGTGALTLALLTPVKWEWLPALLTGSALGGYCGAHFAVKYGNPVIKRIFEGVTMLVGLSLILSVTF
ncbi:sulfite exporter TauE/SafE family protein [Teredinibacter turnerae]|uniref:sulfite exporter TauE/SafE family protein n=1 Tax=Teredinibacter turnerae TaxID=2426 RepID=UPI000382204D|nr:sulfite exporter TauE/SafE family protein [Teredinibacter turnerae]